MREKIEWQDMKDRRIAHGITQMFKIVNGMAPNYLKDSYTLTSEIHNCNTRRASKNICIDKGITSKIHRDSFRFQMSSLYNIIPESVKNIKSVINFTNKIKELLMNESLKTPPK